MIELVRGNILDNWCAGNNKMILLVGHAHLLKGRYYLNNPAIAAAKNLIPDFYEFMEKQLNSAFDANGPDYPYTIVQYNEIVDGNIAQRLGFYFTRLKWDDPPVPNFIKAAFDEIFLRIGFHVLYDQPMKPIMIQDPITSDIPMSDKAAEAVRRLYNLYPPQMQVWVDDK